MYLSVLPARMYVCCMCPWCPQRPEEDSWVLGTGVKNDWVPPCGCWETTSLYKNSKCSQTAEPSLQPLMDPQLSYTVEP